MPTCKRSDALPVHCVADASAPRGRVEIRSGVGRIEELAKNARSCELEFPPERDAAGERGGMRPLIESEIASMVGSVKRSPIGSKKTMADLRQNSCSPLRTATDGEMAR
jgi:hypothetical protein